MGQFRVPKGNLRGAASAAGGRFSNRRGRGVATDKQIRTADGDGAPAGARRCGNACHPKSKRRSPALRHRLLLPPHSRGSTCSGTARPQPHHHGGRAAAEVGRRLRRCLRRPAAPLVGERAALAPRLAGQLVVRVRDEGAERGIGHARVRGPGELRPKEASRGGVLQGHIPRERGSGAQAGRRRGLGGCVRRASFACLHGPPAIEVVLFNLVT